MRGEAVRHQHQTVGHVLKRDLRFGLRVFVRLLAVGVNGVDKGILDGLFRRAAVFEPRRIVIVFETVDTVREAQGGGNAHLVFRLVFTVAALALGLPELRHGQRLLTCNFVYIIQNAVGIAVIRLDEFAAFLIAERERHARVDDSLPLERVLKIFLRNVDVGEDGQIGLPAEDGAGGLAVRRLLFHFADELALFKVQGVFKPVAADGRVKILGRILRGAGAEAVQAQREFIVAARVVLVLTACVKLAEDKLPVVFSLFFVPVDRTAAPEVLDLNGMILIARHENLPAVALARFVDGVGQNFKNGVLTALQAVRAENDRRPQPDAVRAL